MSCKNAISIINEKIIKGTVEFHQCQGVDNCVVNFNLKGFKPYAIHAIHIHEYGDLRDGCKSLGAHLNLKNKNHGNLGDIKNSHTGDLINNIHADKNGNFKYSYIDPRIQISGNINKSIIGCSIVIHDGIDDLGLGGNEESLKTGNAGGRMACSIIGKAKDGSLA
jgi:Cu-Zn family superoxide dismutase